MPFSSLQKHGMHETDVALTLATDSGWYTTWTQVVFQSCDGSVVCCESEKDDSRHWNTVVEALLSYSKIHAHPL